jgi:aldose sugar dehydrogenase
MKKKSLASVKCVAAAIYLIVVCVIANAQAVRPEVVASGLQHPWAVAFLPEGRFLVTERMGFLRVIEPNGTIGEPIKGLPTIAIGGQGGLLDVLLDTDFARNKTLFFCFSEAGAGGNGTALARARLSDDLSRLEGLQVIFRQVPKVNSNAHFGCRIVESQTNGQPDGRLFLTLGERYHRKEDAQQLDNHLGKVVRINKDGSVPPDNPFAGRLGAFPEIWSYGHRNPQGATRAPDGTLWIHEHGPQGGDEINLPQAGQNYGWPVVSFGENYGGGKIGEGLTAKTGMTAPLHYWVPSIAPSGMTFLSSSRYGRAWVGNLFVGSLKFGYLNRIQLTQPFSGNVVKEFPLLASGDDRVRDVRQGPDGLLYILTDQARGRLIRLLPP